MAKNCPHCGVSVPDDSMFCQNCGSNLPSYRMNVTNGQRNKKARQTGTGDTDGTIKILNIALAVLAVIQLMIICFVTPGWLGHKNGVGVGSAVTSAIVRESR